MAAVGGSRHGPEEEQTMRLKYIIIVLPLLAFISGFSISQGIQSEDNYNFPPPDGSIDHLIDFFEYAQYSHQYYVDHPEKQTIQTGDTQWNLKIVEYYKQAIKELKE